MTVPKPTGLSLASLLLLSCAFQRAEAQDRSADAHPDATGDVLRFGDPETLAYTAPFFEGEDLDPAVPAPDAILGQVHGSRLSHHAEILAGLRALAASSDRIRIESFGRTHEGRELVWAAISTPANLARLDSIRGDLGRLADPRELSDADAERIVEESPAIAWMAYSIHGDELSGSDAALALAYHLVADRSADTTELLDQLVVVIDPCQNPDGRERIIGMVEQSAGYTPNLDYAAMQRGRWPYGRGNHYLFDMNRDWMAGTQPESRARWKAVLSFHPQLLVDVHEMWSQDTFLFYPQAKPFNPQLPPGQLTWNRRYAADAARAFDAQGWTYYTREWADAWGPFYSDAWGALTGATGILYEQAATYGFPLRRESGAVLTYREAVHHQATASLANLRTLRSNRAEALRDYLAVGRENVAADTPGNDRMFVLHRDGNLARTRALVETLLDQGIEVYEATKGFGGNDAERVDGGVFESVIFQAGSLVVYARQPARARVRAFLDFDPRYDREALQAEREELERKGRSKAYDLTGWSLGHAHGANAYWCDTVDVSRRPVERASLRAEVEAPESVEDPVAWIVDAADDDALRFAARALELGLAVHASDEPFVVGKRRYERGSFLVRRGENDGTADEIAGRVRAAAAFAGVPAVPTGTSRAPTDETADLGGQHFRLLVRPRVALLSNAPVSPEGLGHLWHHLDTRVGVPHSLLDAQQLGDVDLRRYNVLVLPPASGLDTLLEPHLEALRSWVEGGGTLIACGEASAALTRGRLGLSSVALRQDALDDLQEFLDAAARERAAREVQIDEALVWNGPPETTDEAAEEEKEEEQSALPFATAEEDERARLFSPQGVTLRATVNVDSWITAGTGAIVPVLVTGSNVFLAKPPVTTAVRLERSRELRLGGLLWPEARARLAESSWLTVERVGHGQIVLFSAPPAFRGYHAASARLFANAVVLGPGLGTDQPSGW
jgi:hypothetical protein